MRKRRNRKPRIFRSYLTKNSPKGYLFSFGFTLALILIFSYVFQVTEMARELYSVQSYSQEIKEVSERNKRSEYDFLRSNSIHRAEELISEMNFIKVEEAHYINVPDRQVASK